MSNYVGYIWLLETIQNVFAASACIPLCRERERGIKIVKQGSYEIITSLFDFFAKLLCFT
jgi:hypothetical protein